MILILLILFLLPAQSSAVDEDSLKEALDAVILPYYNNQIVFGAFKGIGGLSLSYAKLEFSNEKGALIISSGRTESHVKYAELIYDLSQAGYSIYILDHRGQGFSTRLLDDPQKGYVEIFDDYVTDLKIFVDTIVNSKYHLKRFVLAHSMGGTIATLYAQKHPHDFDGLILCAPMLQIDTGALPQAVVTLLANGLTALGRGEAYVPGRGGYDPDKPFEGNDLTHSQTRYSMNKELISRHPEIALGGPTNRWLKEALKAGRRAGEEAMKIEIPVLLLQAGADRVVKPGGQDEFCGKAKNCVKVIMADANHEILMEADKTRDEALTHILNFLNKHASTN